MVDILAAVLTDGIAEIRLNRPQRLNAVTQQLYDELNDALTRAEADRDARVVLITGEGKGFCSGADLSARGDGSALGGKGGGGRMSMMYGRVFEKVGVHTSTVHGEVMRARASRQSTPSPV